MQFIHSRLKHKDLRVLFRGSDWETLDFIGYHTIRELIFVDNKWVIQ